MQPEAQPPSQEAPKPPPAPAEARAVLTEIAAGPERARENELLTRGAHILLDKGDPRLAIVAVARSADETPLGRELRRDALAMIAELGDGKGLSEEIAALNLPKTDPARSEFVRFLEQYSKNHPDKAVSPTLIEAIRTRKSDARLVITQELQKDTGLAAKLWEEMKGDGTQSPPNVTTPEGLLSAAGLEATPENTAKAQKLYEPKGLNPFLKALTEFKSEVPSFLITSGMILMLVSQFVNQNEGGAGGH